MCSALKVFEAYAAKPIIAHSKIIPCTTAYHTCWVSSPQQWQVQANTQSMKSWSALSDLTYVCPSDSIAWRLTIAFWNTSKDTCWSPWPW